MKRTELKLENKSAAVTKRAQHTIQRLMEPKNRTLNAPDIQVNLERKTEINKAKTKIAKCRGWPRD